jgi:hypothetical protein
LPALTDTSELIGFFSYSRDDDRGSEGALTLIRRRIQDELRAQLGRSEKTLRLWQDAEAIPPGTLWESEISGAIEQSVFFIPIISPRVIQSEHCGIEFRKFIVREQALARTDLIFPILYIDIPALHDEAVWRCHPTLKVVDERQYVDWCEFRFEPDGPKVRRAIAKLCTDIVGTLGRNISVPRKAPDPVEVPLISPGVAPIVPPASGRQPPPRYRRREAPTPTFHQTAPNISQGIATVSRPELVTIAIGVMLIMQSAFFLYVLFYGISFINLLRLALFIITVPYPMYVGATLLRVRALWPLKHALYTSLTGIVVCFASILIPIPLFHLSLAAISELRRVFAGG